MPKFTPGPWRMAPAGRNMRDNYSQPFAIAEVERPNLVCGCFGDVRGGESVAEANAQLIAAAPEMYAALRHLEDHCSVKTGKTRQAHADEGQEIRAKIRALLARIEGVA